MTVYRFWCEWDIGINSCIWADYYDMKEDVARALEECGIEESVDDLADAGLLGFDSVKVIG
ncbi:hypothetical protein QE320_gp122 [Pseudomonas phage EM]|uniref:Uncharacterized protein n=1 Tax=Pseudomonas phage EM TaxID=2936914 RepID=A0AAE9HHK6_9CAUD|nr:hypothetical protein QE320_gp122 [Pseudomonas phage EM]UPW35932.1 hypothetical protein EM_147 [Pseudomonas phage EM]